MSYLVNSQGKTVEILYNNRFLRQQESNRYTALQSGKLAVLIPTMSYIASLFLMALLIRSSMQIGNRTRDSNPRRYNICVLPRAVESGQLPWIDSYSYHNVAPDNDIIAEFDIWHGLIITSIWIFLMYSIINTVTSTVGIWTYVSTMMTSPNGNSFRVTGHLCKRLSKQSWGWWFETPSHSLWRHRNACMPNNTSDKMIHPFSNLI